MKLELPPSWKERFNYFCLSEWLMWKAQIQPFDMISKMKITEKDELEKSVEKQFFSWRKYVARFPNKRIFWNEGPKINESEVGASKTFERCLNDLTGETYFQIFNLKINKDLVAFMKFCPWPLPTLFNKIKDKILFHRERRLRILPFLIFT